jgi:hypothetical protein
MPMLGATTLSVGSSTVSQKAKRSQRMEHPSPIFFKKMESLCALPACKELPLRRLNLPFRYPPVRNLPVVLESTFVMLRCEVVDSEATERFCYDLVSA